MKFTSVGNKVLLIASASTFRSQKMAPKRNSIDIAVLIDFICGNRLQAILYCYFMNLSCSYRRTMEKCAKTCSSLDKVTDLGNGVANIFPCKICPVCLLHTRFLEVEDLSLTRLFPFGTMPTAHYEHLCSYFRHQLLLMHIS